MGKYDFSLFLVLVCGVVLFSLVEESRKFQVFEKCILILDAVYFCCHVPWKLNFQTDNNNNNGLTLLDIKETAPKFNQRRFI